eukprot:15161016-Ditylum_brightwellii.AAC.1
MKQGLEWGKRSKLNTQQSAMIGFQILEGQWMIKTQQSAKRTAEHNPLLLSYQTGVARDLTGYE